MAHIQSALSCEADLDGIVVGFTFFWWQLNVVRVSRLCAKSWGQVQPQGRVWRVLSVPAVVATLGVASSRLNGFGFRTATKGLSDSANVELDAVAEVALGAGCGLVLRTKADELADARFALS